MSLNDHLREHEQWWVLAVKACNTDDVKEKIDLLKSSIKFRPCESWPLIHLAELEENVESRFLLYLDAIVIDNSHYAYLGIFKIMADYGYTKELEYELYKIDTIKTSDKNVKKSIENFIEKLMQAEGPGVDKDLRIESLVKRFLSISFFHKEKGISIKCALSPRETKCLIDYKIEEGRVIVEEINKKYRHSEDLNGDIRVFDFIVDMNNKLLIGFEHTYMSNRSFYVKAAGTLSLNYRGDLISISNWSGHYRPTITESLNFKELIGSFGVCIKNAKFNIKDYKNWQEFTSNK